MFKLYLEKAEEPEIKLPISAESSQKQEFQKKKKKKSISTSTSTLLTTQKPLTVDNFGQFLNRWE